MAQLQILETEARDHFYDKFYPYLATRINLKDLDKALPQFLNSYPWEQHQTAAYTLLSDQEFLNIVYIHWVLKVNILTNLEPAEDSLSRIRDLIESERSD